MTQIIVDTRQTDTQQIDTRQKDATDPVRVHHAAVRATLPFSDTTDFEDAARGFIASRDKALVTAPDGRVVWDLEPYNFIDREEAPGTVNPSLWRQARLNMHHGLFEVVPGVYQVRGYDLANITLIEGDTGVIVVDALTSIEGARAAMELYFVHRGHKPVVGLLFTHTHADHWGGARGVLDSETIAAGRIPIVAPQFFMEHVASESIIAGPAMVRRAHYQFGKPLQPGERGHVDCGLGKSIAAGTIALVRPNDFITHDGETRRIDGVEFEFQMAPNSEAPAELHFYTPRYRVLNLAENATHHFHNLLPFRGAEVRDPLAWSKYINTAWRLWGDKAEALVCQHHWPVWGRARIDRYLRQQRDLYKFVHDQAVRLMNHGLTPAEIAETIRLPDELKHLWHTRGYYGDIRHNVKAIYQRYLGWYDANPANLDPLPRVEAGRKFVEYMGGAEPILTRARKDFAAGEFRFIAQALSHLVFADPDNEAARALLADTFEQLGYLAESATWRNSYLLAAQELRHGTAQPPRGIGLSLETLSALGTEQVWDMLSVRVDPAKAAGRRFGINWIFIDTNESWTVTLEHSTLTYLAGAPASGVDTVVTLPRAVLDKVIVKQTTFRGAIAAGVASVSGDAARLDELIGLWDQFPRMFDIAGPARSSSREKRT